MGKGRKPKPTTLHIRDGTLNATRHADRANEVRPDVKIPDAPAIVKKNEAAHEEWQSISRELAALGLLTEIDRTALAAYCIVYARWCRAVEEIDFLTMSTDKSVIVNPLVVVARQCEDTIRKYLVEFGMTPSSRTKVRATEPLKKSNAKSRFIAS